MTLSGHYALYYTATCFGTKLLKMLDSGLENSFFNSQTHWVSLGFGLYWVCDFLFERTVWKLVS